MLVPTSSVIFHRSVQLLGAMTLGLFVVACSAPDVAEPMAEASKTTADATETAPAIAKSPNDGRDYRVITLDNRLEVLMVSDPAVEKSAAALSVPVGSFHNPPEYQGMAHFLEHMLFLGTAKYPEPDQYMAFIQENGGTVNAYTASEITNYMFEVKNSAYPEALDRFSDFFISPINDPQYILKEKNAVNAEWSMGRENDGWGQYHLIRSLTGDHASNQFTTGNLESLEDKPGQSLHAATLDFYDRNYSANLMKVVLVSNLGLDEMEGVAKKYFSPIVDKSAERLEITDPIDFEVAGGKLVRYVPQEDVRELSLEFFIDANSDQFAAKPNNYLSYIIGSEMPGTPATRLKQLGWASALFASASPDYFGNYGLFSINIELTELGMEHREEAVQLVLGYIEKLQTEGVDDRYAAEYQLSLKNRFRFLEKINDFSYVSQLAAAMQEYPVEHVLDAPYYFAGYDQAAIDAVLSQLTPERLQVWYVSKEEPADQTMDYYAGSYSVTPLDVGSAPERLGMVTQYQLALPALNTLLPENFDVSHPSPVPQKVVAGKSREIWLQGSEDFRGQPKGFTQIYLNTASREHSAEAAVMLSIWQDLYGIVQARLSEEAAIAGMSVASSVSHGMQLSFSGFTDKQPVLVAQSLENLSLTPSDTELDQAKDRFRRSLENRKYTAPFRQLFPSLTRMVRSGNFNEPTLLAALDNIDVELFEAFVAEELENAYQRIYMFGNYTDADVARMDELLEEAIPNGTGESYVRPGVYQSMSGSAVVFQAEMPTDDLGMMYLFGAPDNSFDSKARGEVLEAHLGNQAFATLRTEEQLGYAAGGFATEVGDQPYVGLYIQTPVKNPADMLLRFDQFREDFRASLAELGDAEFQTLKAGVLSNLRKPPKNLAQEASPFIKDWTRERYDYDSRDRLIAAVEKVTLSDIQRYYEDTVMLEEPARILIQLKGKRFGEDPFAKIAGAEVVSDIEAFHEAMPRQVQ